MSKKRTQKTRNVLKDPVLVNHACKYGRYTYACIYMYTVTYPGCRFSTSHRSWGFRTMAIVGRETTWRPGSAVSKPGSESGSRRSKGQEPAKYHKAFDHLPHWTQTQALYTLWAHRGLRRSNHRQLSQTHSSSALAWEFGGAASPMPRHEESHTWKVALRGVYGSSASAAPAACGGAPPLMNRRSRCICCRFWVRNQNQGCSLCRFEK